MLYLVWVVQSFLLQGEIFWLAVLGLLEIGGSVICGCELPAMGSGSLLVVVWNEYGVRCLVEVAVCV